MIATGKRSQAAVSRKEYAVIVAQRIAIILLKENHNN